MILLILQRGPKLFSVLIVTIVTAVDRIVMGLVVAAVHY